jgi:plastocyanin
MVPTRATESGRAILLAASCLLAAVTACSSGSAPSTGTPGSGASPTGATVTVGEREFTLTPARTQLTPGTYTFVAQNVGTIGHALAIAGPGVSPTQTPVIPPGGQALMTVNLQQGAYELWCPVDGHKALGMDTHIQVGGTAGPAATAPSTISSAGGAY